ncbi:hypothetical protein JK386_02275 [Nocardioides sp. zg-536]|uniref:Uncharacterized protein n=1 Tax=Nocardioides faecalis TaxID=2803858 RepID=A0A938Y2E9_9ACTN|nr:hypothetical protein [Nocardioides faecalis]MBM9458718.1 hypothetical protein [Nocardioides faecalis]QVI58705.1 hypothetical protein KG111_17370 [Nocardioides faecalis]
MSGGRAWGWVAALRSGSTVGWQTWRAQGADAEPFEIGAPGGSGARSSTQSSTSSPTLPGAQQLALLRAVNTAAASTGRTVPRATADRVLAAGVSGRGRGDLPLLGADEEAEASRFGLRPVDPDTLPAGELLRVAAGMIADDVAATDPTRTEGGRPVRPGRPRIRPAGRAQQVLRRLLEARRPGTPYVVLGPQWRCEAVRAGLVAAGRPPGGRRPVAYLLLDDLGTVLSQAWTARSFDQGGLTWGEFLNTFVGSGRVPPRADLTRMARAAAQRYGAEQVRLVIDPAALAAELGVAALAEPPHLGANAVDLVRRVGEPLGILVPPERRPELLRATLLPRLSGLGGPTPTVPERHRPWLATQAERTHHDLSAAGYPVLGDLDRLLVVPEPGAPVRPTETAVMQLAVDLLLDPVGGSGGREGPGRPGAGT